MNVITTEHGFSVSISWLSHSLDDYHLLQYEFGSEVPIHATESSPASTVFPVNINAHRQCDDSCTDSPRGQS